MVFNSTELTTIYLCTSESHKYEDRGKLTYVRIDEVEPRFPAIYMRSVKDCVLKFAVGCIYVSASRRFIMYEVRGSIVDFQSSTCNIRTFLVATIDINGRETAV